MPKLLIFMNLSSLLRFATNNITFSTFLISLSFFPSNIVIGQTNEDSLQFSIIADDILVTAQHAPTHYSNAQHKVTVIKEKTLQERGVVQLDQALQLIPFIRVVNDAVLGNQIIMRGMTANNVAILIDGIPIIGRLNGAIDLSQISVKNIQRIEIVDGPLSALYGNNAAGGVINIITKKSDVNSHNISGEHQVESIGIQNHNISASTTLKQIHWRINGRYLSNHPFPIDSLRLLENVSLPNGPIITQSKYPWNPKKQFSLSTQLRYQIAEQQSLIGKIDWNKEEVIDYGNVRRPTFNPYANDGFYTTTRRDIALLYTGKFSNNIFTEATSAYNSFRRQTDEKRYYLESMDFDPNLHTSDTSLFQAYFAKATVSIPFGNKWSLLSGIQFNKELGSGDRIKIDTTFQNAAVSTREIGVFTDVKYAVSKSWSLNLTARLTNHNLYNSQSSFGFQSKATLFQFLTWRASLAQGYRSPALKELYIEFIDVNHYIIGNNNLTPELSQDIQSTFTWQKNNGIEISFNAYKTLLKNRITLTEFEPLKYRYDNISSYDVYGFQPSVRYKSKTWETNTSFSLGYWSSAIDINADPIYGSVLDLNQLISGTITPISLNWSVNYRYIGTQPIFRLRDDVINIDKIDAYHLLDASLSKSFWKNHISLVAGIKNITNVRQLSISGTNSSGAHSSSGINKISQGRNYFVTFGWNF